MKQRILSSTEAELKKENESILSYVDAFVIKQFSVFMTRITIKQVFCNIKVSNREKLIQISHQLDRLRQPLNTINLNDLLKLAIHQDQVKKEHARLMELSRVELLKLAETQ